MFTAEEIRSIGFSRTGIGGYRTADVDDFKDEVANDFETLERSNKELVEKIKILASHIEKFKENEEAVKNSIINAQITADNVIKKANKDSKELVGESNEKAQRILEEAQNKADALYDEAKRKSEEFITLAREKSDAIVSDAESKAIALRNETDKKVDMQKKVYDKLKNEIISFRDVSIENCKQQLEILSKVSNSELFLDTVISEDTTNEDFNKKIVNDEIELEKELSKVPIDDIDDENAEIEIIDDENDDLKEESLFEYLP